MNSESYDEMLDKFRLIKGYLVPDALKDIFLFCDSDRDLLISYY